jgi:hippurate hydrolase/N-acetyldiaminopimelate deacetylase
MQNPDEGKAVCFRADMDGLNIHEETGLSFASDDGNMHACGHDAHMAILLGLAKHIADNNIKKNIVLLFQPGEENAGGADVVMKDENFNKFDIGSIFGLHVQPEIEEGKIGLKSGPFIAQTIEFNIKIEGKSSHGAQPHKGIDSILVASQLVNGYQSIISRNTAPLESAVLTIGKIVGGQARNIIAEETRLEGTLRTFDIATYEGIRKRINEMNGGLENMYNVKITADFIDFCPPVVNDNNLYENKKRLNVFDYFAIILIDTKSKRGRILY